MDNIYKMELHEKLIVTTKVVKEQLIITRVAGGWLYAISEKIVFVPYNNEFRKI